VTPIPARSFSNIPPMWNHGESCNYLTDDGATVFVRNLFLVCLFVFLREWEVVFIRTTTFRSIILSVLFYSGRRKKQKYLTRCELVCWDMIFHSLSIHRSLDWISKEKTKRENSGEEKVKRVTVKVQSWVVVHSRSTRLYVVQLFFILFSIRIITQDPCWLNKKNNQPFDYIKNTEEFGWTAI
jgi:hypothetical protein